MRRRVRQQHRHARLLVALVELGAHVGVALAGVRRPQHHADQPHVVAHGRGHEIAAGRIDVAGLEPVGTRIRTKLGVMVQDHAAAEHETRRREIVIVAREVADQMDGQRRHVARRRPHIGIGQARGVAENGVAHPQRMGAQRHHLRESVLGAAEILAEHGGGVVGRERHHAEHRLAHRERAAGVNIELHRLHGGGVLRDRHRVVQRHAMVAQRLEQHVERHQLGEARRMARRVGVHRRQHLPGRGIDHDLAEPIRAHLRPRGRCQADQAGRQQRRPCRTPACPHSDRGPAAPSCAHVCDVPQHLARHVTPQTPSSPAKNVRKERIRGTL